MNIVSIILVILIILYIFYSNKRTAYSKRNFITWGCTLLALEAGLRHIAVGPDTVNYYDLFQQASNASWSEILSGFLVPASEFRDPAYPLIEKIFSTIIPSWQMFLAFIAAFYFFSLWRLFNRYIETLEGGLFAFVLYLALFNIVALSGLRQCITTGIAFFLIPLINDNKWKKVIPIVLLGSTIHISLLFILLLLPLMMLKNKLKKTIYLFSISLIPIIAFAARNIIIFMVSFLANDYYAGYANAEQDENPIVYVLLCSIISIYEYFNYNKLISSQKTSFLIPSNILMTLFVPLIFLDGSMIRIGQYFTLYMTISLPLIFDYSSKNRKLAYLVCIILLSLKIFTSGNTYYFFWETVSGFYY